MNLSFLCKVCIFVSMLSAIDCIGANFIKGSLDIELLFKILSDWFQKITSIEIRKSNCESSSIPNITGLDVFDNWYKSLMCLSNKKKHSRHLLKFFRNLLRFRKHGLSTKNTASAGQKSTKETGNSVCPNNEYQWKTPTMYVGYFDKDTSDFALYDLIDGNYKLRKKRIGIKFVALLLLTSNTIGDQLYMIDYEHLSLITKDACSDEFKLSFTERAFPKALTLDPSQKYLLATFQNGTISAYSLGPNGTINETGTSIYLKLIMI